MFNYCKSVLVPWKGVEIRLSSPMVKIRASEEATIVFRYLLFSVAAGRQRLCVGDFLNAESVRHIGKTVRTGRRCEKIDQLEILPRDIQPLPPPVLTLEKWRAISDALSSLNFLYPSKRNVTCDVAGRLLHITRVLI